MGLFKKIGRGCKKALEGIGDFADKITDGIANIAEFAVDTVGDVTEGVTRVVAGDKAADKVKNGFDNIIEPAIERSVKGLASITPVGMLGALDDMAQKGFIDGITTHVIDSTQDVMGGATRLVAGEKAEQKFDTVFDEKIQSYAEMLTGIAARVALCVVPGGQAILLADAASEVASLGYRAANDEKLGAFDYIGAGASFIGIGAGGTIKNIATGVGKTTAKNGTNALIKNADDVIAKNADDVIAKNADDVIAKNADDVIAKNADDVIAKNADDVIAKNADDIIAKNADDMVTDTVSKTALKTGDDVIDDGITATTKASDNSFGKAPSWNTADWNKTGMLQSFAFEAGTTIAMQQAIMYGMEKYNEHKANNTPELADTSLPSSQGGYAMPIATSDGTTHSFVPQ